MKDLATKFAALLCCLLLSGAATAAADDAAALKDEMANLNRQMSTLEAKFAGLQQTGAVPTYVATSAGAEKSSLISDIQIGGYVETQYNQNLTRGGNPIAGGNTGRIFDNDRESFTVNAVEIDLTKEANPEGGAGFRVDIAMGEDSQVVNSDGNGDKFNLQQAYVEYNQSLAFLGDTDLISDTINFKAGRFVTLAGNEVIEGPDNWNISRSYAFGDTIPFVHTGVRSNFQVINDFFDVYVGVNNGWDNPVDNNKGKTFEFGLGYSPIEKVSVFHSIYFGSENNGGAAENSGGGRFLSSNVISFEATDKLTLKGEINFGTQQENSWQSYNAYARYALTDKWAVAYRLEFFHDDQAFRSGLSDTLFGNTLTLERQIADNLIGRLEYRLDRSNDNDAYGDGANMQTIGAQLIYVI